MNALTERQMHDLAGRLTRLRAIDAEICTQIDELIGALAEGAQEPVHRPVHRPVHQPVHGELNNEA